MLGFYAVKFAYSSNLPRNTITVSANLRRSLKLNPGQKFDLRFGTRKVPVSFLGPHDAAFDQVLCASDNLRDILLVPAHAVINLAIDNDQNIWSLGPLIGIFANRFAQSCKPFGEQTSFFRKLNTAASAMNSFCCAFGPEDIDWENKTIRGSVPPLPDDNSTEWQTVRVPFPDVIYDRGLFPKGNKRRTATETRRILRKYPGVLLFNPAFFGKWKTHKLLTKHEVLYKHLPETRLYTDMTDVRELLARHGTIYLKPSGGSSGKGILRLSAAPQSFILDFRVGGQVKTHESCAWPEIENYLSQLMGRRRYIVQQGLKLAKVKGCPFDVRALMQRNRGGFWLRTGMAVRVANYGNYISNLHAGGHAQRLSAVLPMVFTDLELAGRIINEIRRICALIASWVVAKGHPLFGEIAVDLGIDESGKVWIIELNAIPGRSVFRRTKSVEILTQAIRRPMEFAFFLSGFAPQANNK